ncbi:MAG: ABC transporter permease [Flavobacteriales bacterium]|nr:ABC transporter permease [Flavobacteriales bacterium]
MFFYHVGRYLLLISRSIAKPESFKVFKRSLVHEIDSIGINSLAIVAIISLFMGMVVTIQTAVAIDNPFVPDMLIGFTSRQSMVLEFSTTIIGLILTGKVGSSIVSEIGTMRVTEQIDALEMMGINSANHLIFPKMLAAMFINPFLVILSMGIGILSGWLVGDLTGLCASKDYLEGIQYDFEVFHVFYALVKSVCFAFLFVTIPAYFGYYVKGGAIEVGKAGTSAVVWCSGLILAVNYVLTQLMLI